VSDLSPEARALLAAAADGDDPTPADRDRVARAIAVPLGITALVPATAQAAGGALGATTGITLAKVVAASVVVLGLGGGAWEKARHAPPAAARATSARVVRSVTPAVPQMPAPRVTPPVVTPVVTPVMAAPTLPAEARTPLRRTRPGSETEGSLRAESELIAAAHRALLRGDAADALARIAEYDARFPRGTLREERDLERVLALCAAGRRDESRAAARRFLRSFPDSPSAGRAASACTETIPSRPEDPPGTEPATTAPAASRRSE
jgi:hypothetical protein